MTTGALLLAARSDPGATAAAVALWADVAATGMGRHPVAGLALIAGAYPATADITDELLVECVFRIATFLQKTEALAGLQSMEEGDLKLTTFSEYHGSPLRRSGVLALLAPWARPTVGMI